MQDFTLKTYTTLLKAILENGYKFLRYDQIQKNPKNSKFIVLRNDVDNLKQNSLQFAKIQSSMGITGTYYFRIVPQSFDVKIIKEIYSLGHEIGYHYEDVSLVAKRLNDNIIPLLKNTIPEKELVKIAIKSFEKNLESLRQIVPVTTICMHGSPTNRWDNRLLWEYYDYRSFGIIGEPYFDVNFNEVFYLTDTGRRWDGRSVSVRDKTSRGKSLARSVEASRRVTTPSPIHMFHSTFDIIKAVEGGELPDKTMMTFHPQRWTDATVPWVKELIWQNVKNVGKYFLVKLRN